MFEIEKKAWLDHPENVLDTLKSNPQMEYQARVFKQDLYFTSTLVQDFNDIQKQDTIFRVRYIENIGYLTLKYKTLVGNTEVNQELEVEIHTDHIQKIEEFLAKLGCPHPSLEDVQKILHIESKEDWINFWEYQGFNFLLDKTKETELFTLQREGLNLSVEFNYIHSLGHFLEIEGLTDQPEKVDDYIRLIDQIFLECHIPAEKEEPKLYIELLFQKKF